MGERYAQRFDAVIIGGGHNGLVTAAYLARAGLQTLVLERRPVLGGACVTEEPWPGYKVSTLAYLCSLFQPRIVHDLQLARFGYGCTRKTRRFSLPSQMAGICFSGTTNTAPWQSLRKFSAR